MFDWNRDCRCLTLDREQLRRLIDNAGFTGDLSEHLFASVPVYVDGGDLIAMSNIVRAIEGVAARPAYRQVVLRSAPPIARHPVKHLGVFFGYDFHVGADGPQLIEINTNAGGGLLNAFLARAQRACCSEMEGLSNGPHQLEELENVFVAMFRSEWRRARGDVPLKRVAIIDDAPEQQYLYPEFGMFRDLFRRHGIDAEIADARELTLQSGTLFYNDLPIDLVYNRVTDFYFDDHPVLRDAYLSDAAVITPHPAAHALIADKRNLVLLSDLTFLASLDLPGSTVSTLADGIPKTIIVDKADAEVLWADRKRYFFKPVHGYGSKAAYRGDKLTKRVWSEILEQPYVAQRIVPPSERTIHIEGSDTPLKLDIRAYTYAAENQLFAARLYSGQTTNFRTPGGGFATVFTQPLPLIQRIGVPGRG